jgi:hypothetical protein
MRGKAFGKAALADADIDRLLDSNGASLVDLMKAEQKVALRYSQAGPVRRHRDGAACCVGADAPLEKGGLDEDCEIGVVDLWFDRNRQTRQL